MGGENEAVLKKEKKQETVLKSDAPPVNTPPFFSEKTGSFQKQEIRMHLNSGHVHLHEDVAKIKVAVPVAEWYVIQRQIKSMNKCTFVDVKNKSVAYFNPVISNGIFETNIELFSVEIGSRIQDMEKVTNSRN